MQDVATTDREAGDHRDDRLRAATHLNLKVEHVEAANSLLRHLVVTDVAVVAADSLIAAGTEGHVALPREDDHADLWVVLGLVEGLAELEQRLRAKRVADLWAADRDLCDPVAA